MSEKAIHCRVCDKKLTGSKENEFLTVGKFVHLVTRDSADCNWRRCHTCKDIICKRCYKEQLIYCCEADYVAGRERAQMLADQQHNKTQSIRRKLCQISRSFI